MLRGHVVKKRYFLRERGPEEWAGYFGPSVLPIVRERTDANVVMRVSSVRSHYWERHQYDFDVALAEGMLPGVLQDPWFVYQGKKKTTLVLVGEFDQEHYLLLPVKCYPHEAWLESLYIDRKGRFLSRMWVREGLLYRRQ